MRSAQTREQLKQDLKYYSETIENFDKNPSQDNVLSEFRDFMPNTEKFQSKIKKTFDDFCDNEMEKFIKEGY